MKTVAILFLPVLFIAAFVFSCSDDDDDDDETELMGDWPEGLPDCGNYVEPSAPFEISDLYDIVSDFEDVVEDRTYGFAEATAHLDGDTLTVESGEWSMDAVWKAENGRFPIDDGQAVKVYAATIDGDRGTARIWVADEDYDVLLFETTDIVPSFPVGERGGMTFEWDLVCEYRQDGLPPINEGFNWLIVFGRSLSGTINGSPFEIDRPGEVARTADGAVDVYHLLNYEGETDGDPTTSESGPFRADTWIQMVGVRD